MNPSTETTADAFITGDLSRPLGRPLTIAILGAGARGTAFADLVAERPEVARVTAVAEPRERFRGDLAAKHHIAPEFRFTHWRDLLARPRLADIALIAVQDAEHAAAATALAGIGYQILLEKPMATNEADCEAIAEAARRNGITLAVCHVMRYTPYTVKLKQLLREGAIGDIVSLQHLEPIGNYHFAHSYVRGNWRREDESSPLLLSKSCHDIDWMADIVGQRVARVSSFGSLTHFRPEAAPEGASDRCVTCLLQDSCAYSATTLYRDGLRDGRADDGGAKRYMTRVVTGGELTEQAVADALTDGPYGRCVYRSDNDVPDHQVVNLEFENGVTAGFTLTAFTPLENRHTKIFGSHGQLTGDGRRIEIYDFRTEQRTLHDTAVDGPSAAEGHGGGDRALLNAYLDALHGGRPELIVSGIEATLASHRVVFAAEHARRTGGVVEL
ncbi:Gfo/Idh/MocA family oxidoreductase [Kitasatospora paracochleata]|uniref:Dehydrogenase n=1 Tax=Kitasatospora paracochleata TaxID=58354 RepID=A0ABT1IX15_9ACTN|nr:Gfo/Idh/MocA family oxidoreductase [Kitasatospora paracochleata]MCP2309421.1 putative dehydrogenase [Kitasatospora paracochleata]